MLRRERAVLGALCVCALLVLGTGGQAEGGSASATRGSAAAPPSLPRAENAFASNLYAQLATASGNVVFSPSSVSAVLGMLLTGARGTTASQLRSALHLDGFDDNQVAAAARELREQLAPLADSPQTEVLSTDELWPQQ